MKKPIARRSKETPTPVFQVEVRKRVGKPKAAIAGAKSLKRDNIFSKSRDLREVRGTRQMKTQQNPQTLPHGR